MEVDMTRILNQIKKTIALASFGVACISNSSVMTQEKNIQILDLDILSYQDFVQENPDTLNTLKKALYEKGIVGIKGVPGYKDKVQRFIQTAQAFSALPENVKESYAPNHDLGEMFLGYEKGKEQFKRPDGKWVVDDLKVSYYAFVPDSPQNKWPVELDLKTPFQDIGMLMSEMGKAIMSKIGLLEPSTNIALDGIPQVGRMLYYRKSANSAVENPLWCGSHFDHGIFTTLLPAFYFVNGEAVPEPIEAGLFVKTIYDGVFKKVIANDPDVMLFQVGEFGQLATNDAIKATEHRVHKASGEIERYTMAVFFSAPDDTIIHSVSELTQDTRYGGKSGDPCSYQSWDKASFDRYIVKEEPSDKTAPN
jgi:isopenicillin N synthase-like dioxygenase